VINVITIFSIPKSFRGLSEIIQRNAIQSWLKLDPRCEIILCGNDPGVAEAAAEFHVKHIPDVGINEYGTPLLSSAFKVVQQQATGSLICYVNTDIILLNDVLAAAILVPFRQFLLLGQRWNMEINAPIDFDQPAWEEKLRENITRTAMLQPPFGSDYFIFPKDVGWDFPEFAVGRPGWDNWIIYRARKLQIPVVDATEAVTAVHQNHNYAHIPNGINTTSYEGPEAAQNRKLLGGEEYSFNLRDVTHQIKGNSVQKALSFPHLEYRLSRQTVLNRSHGLFAKFRWRLLSALLYRRRYFPTWFLQKIIYSSTK
jgi:hypothetical protein